MRVGIVGSGGIATTHAKALNALPELELAGFSDNGSGKAAKLASQFGGKGFSSVINLIDSKPDMLIIGTPSGTHLEPTLAAAEKGIHVLCEKPLEITTNRAKQMIEAHQKAGTRLGGIFNYRYTESVSKVKEAIKRGRFGKLTYAAVQVPWWRDPGYYKDSWHGTLQLDGGGALINQSIHMVDLLIYFLGEVREVKSFTDHNFHAIDAEDTFTVALRFESGLLAQLSGTTAAYPGRPRRLELGGIDGSVIMEDDQIVFWEFRNPEEGDEEVVESYGKAPGKGGAADPTAIDFDGHKQNLKSFVQAIQEGKPFELEGREAIKALDLVERIYHDAR